jgi:hypothetical protein
MEPISKNPSADSIPHPQGDGKEEKMPKVNLTPDPRAERDKQRRTAIQCKRMLRDIPTQVELSRKAGISEGGMCSKLRSGGWTAEDLYKLDNVLRFSDAELAALVRGQRRT